MLHAITYMGNQKGKKKKVTLIETEKQSNCRWMDGERERENLVKGCKFSIVG